MTSEDIQKIRMQLLFVLGLFVLSISGSIGMAFCPGMTATVLKKIEYRKDKDPEAIQNQFNRLITGTLTPQELRSMSQSQRKDLFKAWLNHDAALEQPLNTFIVSDAGFYTQEAETTLVIGSDNERMRALFFIERIEPQSAIPILEKYHSWISRFGKTDLANETKRILQKKIIGQ